MMHKLWTLDMGITKVWPANYMIWDTRSLEMQEKGNKVMIMKVEMALKKSGGWERQIQRLNFCQLQWRAGKKYKIIAFSVQFQKSWTDEFYEDVTKVNHCYVLSKYEQRWK